MIAMRARSHGYSSFYGAFGVVLVSTAIIGGLLASLGPDVPSPERERQLAAQFLEALLASNIGNQTTLGQAIAHSCFAVHCTTGQWNVSALRGAIGALASPLAAALDRTFLVAITAENLTQLRVGSAQLPDGGTSASFEVFRPRVGDFVGVSALLAPAL